MIPFEGTRSPNWRRLSRRAALRLLGIGAAGGVLLAGCGRGQPGSGSGNVAARFAAYDVADEPNGDLAKVTWPAFVIRAGPEVKQLYEFQIQNDELMRYMPCFCGCGSDGHRNNRDCYVKAVNPDGSVVFDSMAPT